ncbi:phage holin family protein [Rhodovulum marinum]|uniref:Putative superfamily III holin-X n=1 Tax=Rhodovulum marinum TaxID=320662 RepID=A0A4R2Q8L5_9RHOB|nr:phage holin family protein [Rhodovulum marinum]TCP43065.1 putative superfamily III holin-X [Rhodovulum marinum]
MGLHPIRTAERRVADLSRRLALGTIAGLAMAAGLGFLTVAAWLVLSAQNGAVFAAAVIGMAYLGLGLVLAAIAAARRNEPRDDAPKPCHDPQDTFARMAEGFAAGLEAGRAARDGPNGRA